ncbi:MAG: gamma-glutamyl-gamma-aminobutyrate hydrolase family protein [Stellaceae bacterium]
MRSPPLPIIGIPACRRTINERVVHTVADKYPVAVIEATGCLPLLIPAVGSRIDIAALLDRLDGLLLTGSPSNVHPSEYGHEPLDDEILHDPERDATTLPLIREAVQRDLPILAICRGIQELNVALGGTLHQRLHAMPNRISHRPRKDSPDGPYGWAHSVALTPGGLLAVLAGSEEIMVNSLHSQGIDQPAPGLRIEAVAPDGQIEGVTLPQARFVVGVQWHPEYKVLENPVSTALFAAFGRASRPAAAGPELAIRAA